MSSKKLDKPKIDACLMPWLKSLKDGDHYRFLDNATVQSIIVNAAQRGIPTGTLTSQLLKVTDNSKEISHFIQRYDRKIEEFLNYDFKTIMKKSQQQRHLSQQQQQQQQPPVPKQSEQSRPDTQNRFQNQDRTRNIFPQQQNRSQSQFSRTRNSNEPLHLPPKDLQNNKKERNDSVNNISNVDISSNPSLAFFLDSSALSLRHADQKIKKLRFNEEGKRIDEEGNVIETKFAKRNAEAPVIKIDRRIPTVNINRPVNREFKFIEPGSISAHIVERRKEAQIDLSVASGCNIFDTIALSRNYEIPDVDWWDKPYVTINEDENGVKEWVPNFETVNNEYENAAPIAGRQLKVREMPTLISEKEKKRLKHIKKLEKQNLERMMIHLNLKPKEPQKLKQSQMINVNQGKSILAPTEIEMQVKAAKDYRIQKHEKHNQENKLTPEQRSEKNAQKRKSDFENNNITVSVYIVENFNTPLNNDKLLNLANKWFIKGGMFDIKQPPLTFIVAMAGPKGTQKYTKLVESRIKWGSWQGRTVFSGIVTKAHFFNFKKYTFNVRSECRRFMEKYQADELFDAAAREFPDNGNKNNDNDNNNI